MEKANNKYHDCLKTSSNILVSKRCYIPYETNGIVVNNTISHEQ